MDQRQSLTNKKSILRPAEEVKCHFLFDIFVSSFDTPQYNTRDKNKINISLQFNKKIIELSGNLINATDFIHGTGTEFLINPDKLRQNLEQCGMPFTVKYSGKLLGNGQAFFPGSVTEIITEQMSEVYHEGLCDFEKNGIVEGTVQFRCRLILKCQDTARTGQDCRQSMGSCISPHDILFLVSESQRCPQNCDPCLDTWESEPGDDYIHLDLQRYKRFKPEELRPAETFKHNPVGDAITSELKKMTKEFEGTLDLVLEKTRGPKPPCRTANVLKGPCDAPCRTDPEKPKTSLPKAPSLPARLGECTKPSGTQNADIRFCPVCLGNMSWLPLLAACPKCGAKPSPVVKEIQSRQRLKADKIILEYLGKPKPTVDDYCKFPCEKPEVKEEAVPDCRCTCKYGRLCASCRVRKQCAAYIDNKQKRPMMEEPEEEEEEDYCIIDEKPKESRPFLSRVFSELRDMYDIKDTHRPGDKKHCSELRQKHPKIGEPVFVSGPKKKRVSKSRAPTVHKAKKPKRIITSFHKICSKEHKVVSRRHGWNWASTREARKHGWRPGAILKPMRKLMQHFLKGPLDSSPLVMCQKEKQKKEEAERELPTLNMCKRNGEIFVTLRAINDPNVRMKPIVFKIVKSDLAVLMSRIKKKLKQKGFRKCTCHQTVMMCTCRNNADKRTLEYALQKECRRNGIETCVDQLILTDTSESDMEFDFNVTPTSGVEKPRAFVKPRMNHSTQTQKQAGIVKQLEELKVNPLYPIRPSPYYHSYDCAAGDRYTGTAHGKPGEFVREDGLFGYRHGGPHGEPTYPGGILKSKVIWGTQHGGPMHGGGRFGQHTIPGDKTFPGAKKKHRKGKKVSFIPVRMPNRFYIAAEKEKAAKAAKEQLSKQKKTTNMMDYMMKKGAVPVPWNPNAKAY